MHVLENYGYGRNGCQRGRTITYLTNLSYLLLPIALWVNQLFSISKGDAYTYAFLWDLGFDLVWSHINYCKLFNAKSIFIHINSSISNNSVQHKYNFCLHTVKCKTVLFQTIQRSIITQFSSIWPIDRTLSDTTTPGHSGPGSNSNEVVLRIPQSRLFSVISRTLVSLTLLQRYSLLGQVFFRENCCPINFLLVEVGGKIRISFKYAWYQKLFFQRID